MKTKISNNSGPLTGVGTLSTGTSTGTTWVTTTTTNTPYFSISANEFKQPPFSLSFNWEGKTVNISLKNGNDIFKLANAFMKMLDENEIEYEVKTTGKKKKK